MNQQQQERWIAQLKSFRKGRPCNILVEDQACARIRFLRQELPSKLEAVSSIRSYLSSLPPDDSRRENAMASLLRYRGEAESIAAELSVREEVLFDVCSLKCR